MTKRYRLLKDLPSVNKGATIVSYDDDKTYHVKNCNIYKWSAWDIKNSPNYFELIKEEQPKEWEVVEYRNNSVVNPTSNEHCHIHSVKRLSDGEVFRVGDEVTGGWYRGHLESFVIEDSKMNVWFILNGKLDRKYCGIEQLGKYPPPEESKEFVWTDELVMEIVGQSHRDGFKQNPLGVYDRVQSFKKSKSQPQEQSKRIEVDFKISQGKENQEFHEWFIVESPKFVTEEMIPLIRIAIANILNNKSKQQWQPT